jgi:hypothetical protein
VEEATNHWGGTVIDKYINAGLIAALIVNVLSVNYAIGSWIGVSGQTVSTVVMSMAVLLLAFRAIHMRLYPRECSTLFWGFIALVLVAPFVAYLFNYSGQSSQGLLFWLKRSILNIGTLLIGMSVITQLPNRGWSILAKAIFLLTVATLFYSLFWPEQSLLLFTGDEEVWAERAEQLGWRGGQGPFLNANGAAFGLVVCYVVMRVFADQEPRGRLLTGALFDALFLVVLVSTGSRSGVLVGFSIFLILKAASFADAKSITHGVRISFQYLVVSVVFIGAIAVYLDRIDLSPVERLTDFSREDNVASNEARYDSLMDAIDLIGENPFIGLGFEKTSISVLTQPHNMFISYALNNGLFLGLIFPLYAYLMGRAMRDRHPLGGRLAILFSLLAFSMFDHGIVESKQFPWLLIGVALIASRPRALRKSGLLTVGAPSKPPQARGI